MFAVLCLQNSDILKSMINKTQGVLYSNFSAVKRSFIHDFNLTLNKSVLRGT